MNSLDALHAAGFWQAHVVDDCRLCTQQQAQQHQLVLYREQSQTASSCHTDSTRRPLPGWLTWTSAVLTAICSPIVWSLLLLRVRISPPAAVAGLALEGVSPVKAPACPIAASAVFEALLLVESTALLAPSAIAIAILGRLLVLLHIPCRCLPLLLRGRPALWLGRQARLGQQLRFVFSSHGHRASASVSRGCRMHCLAR